MNKIKVLHVYKSFNVYNGLIEILTILAQNMDLDRFELGACVYEYDGNEAGRQFERLGGRIYTIDTGRGMTARFRELTGLVSFFRKHRPDIVQTHVLKANLYGVIAAKLAKVPVVIGTEMTLKDTAPTRFGRFRDRLLQPLAARIIDRCDSFVVTSEFIKREWYGDSASDKVVVVYPPFNLEKLHASERNGSPRTARDGKTHLCYVGRLSEEKGVRTLLDAMKVVIGRNAGTTLTIVGTGPLEAELRGRAATMGADGAISFTGYQANVFDVLKEMDGLVLPSRSEGCPIVVLEAMAMALPVVATAVGGTPELVRAGTTGILVPPNDPVKLAEAMIELSGDPKRARAYGKAGRDVAFADFHPSQFTSRLEDLYMKLYDAKTNN
jgi:glycosyltransferase involved in cell wall biosynthesis